MSDPYIDVVREMIDAVESGNAATRVETVRHARRLLDEHEHGRLPTEQDRRIAWDAYLQAAHRMVEAYERHQHIIGLWRTGSTFVVTEDETERWQAVQVLRRDLAPVAIAEDA